MPVEIGCRIQRYNPLRTSSCPFFNVTTPLQFAPRLSLAQMLVPTLSAVKVNPAHSTPGVCGGNLVSSAFHPFPNNSQKPKITGNACCAISHGVSSFFARFIPNHNSTHTAKSVSHSQLANSKARSALSHPQFIAGTLDSFVLRVAVMSSFDNNPRQRLPLIALFVSFRSLKANEIVSAECRTTGGLC